MKDKLQFTIYVCLYIIYQYILQKLIERTDPTLDPNQELQHFIHAILLRKEYAKEYKLPNVMKPHVQELIEQIQVDEQDQLAYNSQRKRVDKSTFEKAVLEFLRNHHVPMFSKDTARDNPTLTAMAVEILSNGVSNIRQICLRMIY
jgi:hypothetical protein